MLKMHKIFVCFLFCFLLLADFSASACIDVATCLTEVSEINKQPPKSDCPLEIPIKNGDRILGTMAQVDLKDVQKSTGLPLKNPEQKNKVGTTWWKLMLFGVGLAPVEFFVSTAIHEGTHALAGVMVGGKVIEYKPYPHVGDDGVFRFGATTVKGKFSGGEKTFMSVAPMAIDAVILGSYGALVLSDTVPKNKYVQTAMLVFAAGHWVDLANHLFSRNDLSDTAKIEGYLTKEKGWSNAQAKFLVRGSQVATLLASGYFLFKGGQKIFGEEKKDTKKSVPSSIFQPGLSTKEKLNVLDLHVAPGSEAALMGFTISGQF